MTREDKIRILTARIKEMYNNGFLVGVRANIMKDLCKELRELEGQRLKGYGIKEQSFRSFFNNVNRENDYSLPERSR